MLGSLPMLGPLEGPYQSQEHVWGFFVPGPPQRPGTGQRLSTRIAKTLTVGASLQRLGGVSKLVEPKSKHSRRTLRLSPAPLNALQSERQRQREAKIAAGMRWWAPVRAGLPVIRWHHLRHLHGALLLASGVDLATVSHLLGHSSVALTASTYAGVVPSLREDAGDQLERFLSQPG